MQRRTGRQRLRTISEQLEIVAARNRLEQRNPSLMIDRYRADKRDVDIGRADTGQLAEDRGLECEMNDFRTNAGPSKEIHVRRKLRQHQVVDGRVLAARGLYA